MKAVYLKRIGGPESLVLGKIPQPQPKAGEVLVKIKAAALNRRDYWITIGKYADIKYPIILALVEAKPYFEREGNKSRRFMIIKYFIRKCIK